VTSYSQSIPLYLKFFSIVLAASASQSLATILFT